MNYKEFVKKNKNIIIGLSILGLASVLIFIIFQVIKTPDNKKIKNQNDNSSTKNEQPENIIKTIIFKEDDKTPWFVLELDKITGNKSKQIEYSKEQDKKQQITEYNPQKPNMKKKVTILQKHNEEASIIQEFDQNTGNIIREINFPNEEHNDKQINEYDPQIPNREIKITNFKSDGKTFAVVLDFDKKTGNPIKQTQYQEDNDQIDLVADFNPQIKGQVKLMTQYKPDGKTPYIVEEYDQKTGNKIRTAIFQTEENKKRKIIEYDPAIQDKKIRETEIQSDDQKPSIMIEFDQQTGNYATQTHYQENNEKIHFFVEFYPQIQGRLKRNTTYKKDGKTPSIVEEYDQNADNNIIKKTEYTEDDKYKYVCTYDPTIKGKKLKLTKSAIQSDGEKILTVIEYKKNEDKTIIIETNYGANVDKIESMIEYDSSTGKKTKTTTYENNGTTVKQILLHSAN